MTLDTLFKILILVLAVDIILHVYTLYISFMVYRKGVIDATVALLKGIEEGSVKK
jgi:hypothetical protein